MRFSAGAELESALDGGSEVYFVASTAGEGDAAEAAAARLKAKLKEVSRRDPPVELKFSLDLRGHDPNSAFHITPVSSVLVPQGFRTQAKFR